MKITATILVFFQFRVSSCRAMGNMVVACLTIADKRDCEDVLDDSVTYPEANVANRHRIL